jgi:disulfide bond formation protein DsbB|tara:strand:+ start:563 stop:1048 length:486 start_codon:yes stop_codon:yes gene_type:complete
MMSKQKVNFYLIVIFFIILATLSSAFIIEYVLGYKPCNLCLYQRIPYIISIFLIIEILVIKKYVKTTLALLSFTFILSSFLAFYHFGIERGFFNESFVCESKNLSEKISNKQLLEELKNNTVRCKDVSFQVLGLSLASINIIFSAILSAIFIRLLLNYEKN